MLRDDPHTACEHKRHTTLTLRLMNPLISKTCTLKVNRSRSPKLKVSCENVCLKTPILSKDTSVTSSLTSASKKESFNCHVSTSPNTTKSMSLRLKEMHKNKNNGNKEIADFSLKRTSSVGISKLMVKSRK